MYEDLICDAERNARGWEVSIQSRTSLNRRHFWVGLSLGHGHKFYVPGTAVAMHLRSLFVHLQVEPEQHFTASVTLDGAELSYFGQEGMAEVVSGCVTFQFQCAVESTNGTGVQGGQIPELLFYGPTPTNGENRDGALIYQCFITTLIRCKLNY